MAAVMHHVTLLLYRACDVTFFLLLVYPVLTWLFSFETWGATYLSLPFVYLCGVICKNSHFDQILPF